MRRIVVILALVAVVGIAGFFLLRPKGAPKAGKKPSTSTDSGSVSATPAAKPSTVKGGKVAGRLKPKTAADRSADDKRIREDERKRKRELRKQERARRRMLREARSRRGKRSSRKGGQFYVVKAIVSLGSESYALVDSRRVGVGDVVMGRRVVAILPDRIEIEAFGKQSAVRVGESLLPSTYTPSKR